MQVKETGITLKHGQEKRSRQKDQVKNSGHSVLRANCPLSICLSKPIIGLDMLSALGVLQRGGGMRQ